MHGHHFGRNAFLLATAQGLYLISGVTYIMFMGLAGQMLADVKWLATLPVALMTVGTATATVPMSLLMRRIGRRAGFLIGATAGAGSGALGAFAISQGSFELFCAATLVMGVYQACSQYYRFASIESAPRDQVGRAVSFVLLGGVLSALVGPTIAVASRDLLSPVPFAGGFLVSAVVAVVAMVPLALIRIPRPMEEESGEGARPLLVIARQPAFVAAVLNAATSYGLMVLVMTATPIAMVGCGFAMDDTGHVIQGHVLAMFVPSFFTGTLIKRFGVVPVLFTGMALFGLAAAAALAGQAFGNFTVALILLGVAWNFLFVGGTTLLTEAYRPAEKAKVQGVNEFIVFAAAASGSFSSGGLLHLSGWDAVNWFMAPFLAMTFAATAWYARSRRA
ncbi:MAG: MFS transporter [Alphaproteobacteria bacterium]|nr:MFS transporter [Alphaproteobacteria bacterium]MBF0249211.1 MFS transporter [Alphaproteobacteria bacterium]